MAFGANQGVDKYSMMSMAHGQAAVKYAARAKALRSAGDGQGATLHTRIGKSHQKASDAIAAIAKDHAHAKERQQQMAMQQFGSKNPKDQEQPVKEGEELDESREQENRKDPENYHRSRKYKRFERKSGMSDPKYLARIRGEDDAERGKNKKNHYPPGKRHDEYEHGYNTADPLGRYHGRNEDVDHNQEDLTLVDAFHMFLESFEGESVEDAIAAFVELEDLNEDAVADLTTYAEEVLSEGVEEEEEIVEDVEVNPYSALISAAINKKPLEFTQVFGALVQERAGQLVDELKVAVAQETFGEGKTGRDERRKDRRHNGDEAEKRAKKRENIEETEQLDELMGKGKLDDYEQHHARKARFHADRVERRGGIDHAEDDFSKSNEHYFKAERAGSLRNQRDSAARLRRAKKEHEAAKSRARADNPDRMRKYRRSNFPEKD